MDDYTRLSWIFVIALLFLAAFFAVTETAISSVSKIKVKASADKGEEKAIKALNVLDNFDKAITTLLICTNIVHITAASIVTVEVTKMFGLSAVTLSTVITTIAVFFFGEMLPKSIAKKYAYSFTISNCSILSVLMMIFSPLSNLLTKIGQSAANLTKGDKELSVTEDELHDIIEDMTEEGTLEEDEGDLIESAIEFGDATVGSIMTPKKKLTAIDVSLSNKEILEIVKEQNHSRLPVYDGNINNIIGILQIRQFIKSYLDNNDFDIRSILTKPLKVLALKNIDELLPIMQDHKYTIAIVVDKHDRTLGVVSVEDILEELVGEIWDEDDKIGGQA